MKRPCQSDFDTQGMIIPSMVSSPETSSGQAIWQIKTNYNHIKLIYLWGVSVNNCQALMIL
nr:hypothetical protein [Labilibaculum manganireducens]